MRRTDKPAQLIEVWDEYGILRFSVTGDAATTFNRLPAGWWVAFDGKLYEVGRPDSYRH